MGMENKVSTFIHNLKLSKKGKYDAVEALRRIGDFESLCDTPPETTGRDLFKLLTPRSYRKYSDWYHPNLFSAIAANAIAAMQTTAGEELMSENSGVIGISADIAARCKVPTWFVGADLLKAFGKTKVPHLRLADLKWPMPFMLFVFNRSASFEAFGRHVPFIGICKCKAGHMYENAVPPFIHSQWIIQKTDTSAEEIVLIWVTDGGFDWGIKMPILPNEYTSSQCPTEALEDFTYLADDDDAFCEKKKSIAFQCLLAAAEPSMSQSLSVLIAGQTMGCGSTKKKLSPALFEPRWIGRNYRLPVVSGSGIGTHASPCIHWRRGHWRNQPHGQASSERKMIWIEPHIVGA